MPCESCGRHSVTQPATLYQNIGMIAVFRYQTLKGNFCPSCITHYFWEYTLVTLGLGWWGLISFFLTPLILINNLFYFARMHLRHRQPNLGLPIAASLATPEACPRCQSMQASSVGLSRSVWASLIVSCLLLVWAGYLSMLLIQHQTDGTNWLVVGVLVGVNVLVAGCLHMLVHHPIRRCGDCHWTWPAHTTS